MLRESYQGVGHRSHLDRRNWISVDLDSDVPPDEIQALIAHSWDQVAASLTRKQKAELELLGSQRRVGS
jgi:predicted DNA-binding protein (MmcQ/YjbR family)